MMEQLNEDAVIHLDDQIENKTILNHYNLLVEMSLLHFTLNCCCLFIL